MPATRKEFYTAEEYTAAKNANIIYYLQSMGYGLKQEGSDFKGKEHNSLVIRSDGRWFWNSKGIGGKSPIELLKQILINDYGYFDEITAAIEAIKRLASSQVVTSSHTSDQYQKFYPAAVVSPRKEDDENNVNKQIELPEASLNSNHVIAYLCTTRGLDANIVKDLIKQKKIYETKDYHNAVFVSYDNEGIPRYAFMRGTYSLKENQFKKEVTNSDKSYSFTLPGRPDSDRVFCFEAAIDAISHASLCKHHGNDWKEHNRIALGGTSFLGLERFLSENTQIKKIAVCLDNDPTGIRRGQKLQQEYTLKGYEVSIEHPFLKDFNEDLLNVIREDEELEEGI